MSKLLFFFLLLPFLSNAQNNTKLRDDALVSSVSSKATESQKTKVVSDTMPDGDSYVSNASTSLLQFDNSGSYQGLYRPNALLRTQSSLEYKISQMRAERRRGMCVVPPSKIE